VFTVTGKDLEVFINQWVYQSGCAYFTGKCKFNKKRNVVELELKQDSSGKGVLKYVVSMTGSFESYYLSRASYTHILVNAVVRVIVTRQHFLFLCCPLSPIVPDCSP